MHVFTRTCTCMHMYRYTCHDVSVRDQQLLLRAAAACLWEGWRSSATREREPWQRWAGVGATGGRSTPRSRPAWRARCAASSASETNGAIRALVKCEKQHRPSVLTRSSSCVPSIDSTSLMRSAFFANRKSMCSRQSDNLRSRKKCQRTASMITLSATNKRGKVNEN